MEPDLESFPLLRPDQIPLLSTEWLHKSVGEIAALLKSLQTDGNTADSLLHYAEQQQATVLRELSRREESTRMSMAMGLSAMHFVHPYMGAVLARPAETVYMTEPTVLHESIYSTPAHVVSTAGSSASSGSFEVVPIINNSPRSLVDAGFNSPYSTLHISSREGVAMGTDAHVRRTRAPLFRSQSSKAVGAATVAGPPRAVTSRRPPPAWLHPPQEEQDAIDRFAKLDGALGLPGPGAPPSEASPGIKYDSVVSSAVRPQRGDNGQLHTTRHDSQVHPGHSAPMRELLDERMSAPAAVSTVSDFVVEPAEGKKQKRKRRTWETNPSQHKKEQIRVVEHAKPPGSTLATVRKRAPISQAALPLPSAMAKNQTNIAGHDHTSISNVAAIAANEQLLPSASLQAENGTVPQQQAQRVLLHTANPTAFHHVSHTADPEIYKPRYSDSRCSPVEDAPNAARPPILSPKSNVLQTAAPDQTGWGAKSTASPVQDVLSTSFQRDIEGASSAGNAFQQYHTAAATSVTEDVVSRAADFLGVGASNTATAAAANSDENQCDCAAVELVQLVSEEWPRNETVAPLPLSDAAVMSDASSFAAYERPAVVREHLHRPFPGLSDPALLPAAKITACSDVDDLAGREQPGCESDVCFAPPACVSDTAEGLIIPERANTASVGTRKSSHTLHSAIAFDSAPTAVETTCMQTSVVEGVVSTREQEDRAGSVGDHVVFEHAVSDCAVSANTMHSGVSAAQARSDNLVGARMEVDTWPGISARPTDCTAGGCTLSALEPNLPGEDFETHILADPTLIPPTVAVEAASFESDVAKVCKSAPASIPSYARAFPDLNSLFTGCLPSSGVGTFAFGGMSGALARQRSRSDAAVNPIVAMQQIAKMMRSSVRGCGTVEPTPGIVDSDSVSDTHNDDLIGAQSGDSALLQADIVCSHMSWDSGIARTVTIASHKNVLAVVRRGIAQCDNWMETPIELGNLPVWNLMWSWGKPPINRSMLLTFQRVNHFKNAKELTRKDLLKQNLARYQCLGAKMNAAFTLQPPTFMLPKEYLQFAEMFGKGCMNTSVPPQKSLVTLAGDALTKLLGKTASAGAGLASTEHTDANLWIMKPVGLSRGRGISLVSDMAQVKYAENTIIQKYVHNPLLLDGYKFDLRLYVLVTSFCPLEAFIYKRGFARLSSRPFTSDPSQIDNLFIHLTNSSIQKHSETAQATMLSLSGAGALDAGGTKCSLEYLWRRLRELGIDTDTLWENIIDLVVKSLVCVDDVIPSQPNSFEVYGYDVLIDAKLKPWLIEVNGSPSLGVDSEMDLTTKTQMIADTIQLVDPLPFDRNALADVLERRISEVATGGKPNAAQERAQLDADMTRILIGRAPRATGELPACLGHYQRICPGSDAFNRCMKLKMLNFRKRPSTTTTSGKS